MPTALIVGATGLIGRHLTEQLLRSEVYTAVRTLVRRRTDLVHPKLTQTLIDFNDLSAQVVPFQGDTLFCALGTTRAKAGSKAAFYTVDFTYAYAVARMAREQGVRHFSLVSSVGADARSASFYLKTKGELEEAVQGLGFERLHIFRPSFLLGDRGEFRPLEVLGGGVMQVFAPLLGKYAPVQAQAVAEEMIRASLDRTPGSRFFSFGR
ncbi:MAG: NAD(P)H-binding protein [Bernardetiaceae bacterium]